VVVKLLALDVVLGAWTPGSPQRKVAALRVGQVGLANRRLEPPRHMGGNPGDLISARLDSGRREKRRAMCDRTPDGPRQAAFGA
jgi:hypothetical protein